MGKANKPRRDQRPRYVANRDQSRALVPEEEQRPREPLNIRRRPVAKPPMERIQDG